MITENKFKVRLAAASANRLRDRTKGVVFEVAPELSESRQVQYEFLDPLHAPGQIAVYKRSMSRRFQLTSVKFASRSPFEAATNLAYLWTLRGWTMPDFGRRANDTNALLDPDAVSPVDPNTNTSLGNIRDLIQGLSTSAESSFAGAPPQVLEFSAYSSRGNRNSNEIGHIHRVPVVIDSLSIVYPTDCDYIPTQTRNPTPMPTIMTVDITLVETLSPLQLENFSLTDFRLGRL